MSNPPLQLADYVGPLVAAIVFVALMSFVKEPARRNVNVILVAGASGAYLSGGFGIVEIVYPIVGGTVAYFGLRSYRFIGVAWLMHAAWDFAHHLYGNAIWPFMPTSSFGCMLFDSAIAIWFLTGSPSMAEIVGRAPLRQT